MTRATRPTRRTRCSRRIAADPTSTALLLAGPSAMELWPGVRRVAAVEGGMVVETRLPARPHAAATVRALPPHRTPTSYVTRFAWEGPGLPATSGRADPGLPAGRGRHGRDRGQPGARHRRGRRSAPWTS